MATDTVSNGENFAQHLSRNSDDDVICPTCDVKIKRSQVADHCQVEMERLHNPISAVTPPTPTSGATASEESGSVSGGRQPWSVFQRVQRNRQARQRQRTRKRPASPAPPATVNPTVAAAHPQLQQLRP